MKPWPEAHIEQLALGLHIGMSIELIAELMNRDAEECELKARELNLQYSKREEEAF
jgi:hypothetical protein